MNQEKIDRINELYRKKKAGTLTPEEKEEQAALRAEYIAAVRNNLRTTLEHTSIQEPDGTIHKLHKKRHKRMNKKELRRQILAVRDQTEENQRMLWSMEVLDSLMQWEPYQKADIILSYASFRSEVDTEALNRRILSEGKGLYLPRTYPDTCQMKFFRVRAMGDLICGYQGILEPKQNGVSFEEQGDKDGQQNVLMLMPGSAYDKAGNRLGYGGGYYDRYLAQYGDRITHTCMLAYAIQEVENIAIEACDIRPEQIITNRR